MKRYRALALQLAGGLVLCIGVGSLLGMAAGLVSAGVLLLAAGIAEEI